ncbi:MAG: hypothetical protein QF775_02925, partial [archaeon]|nr:hypothetical protein [archaeon]
VIFLAPEYGTISTRLLEQSNYQGFVDTSDGRTITLVAQYFLPTAIPYTSSNVLVTTYNDWTAHQHKERKVFFRRFSYILVVLVLYYLFIKPLITRRIVRLRTKLQKKREEEKLKETRRTRAAQPKRKVPRIEPVPIVHGPTAEERLLIQQVELRKTEQEIQELLEHHPQHRNAYTSIEEDNDPIPRRLRRSLHLLDRLHIDEATRQQRVIQ